MAQMILKAKKRKVSPKKAATKQERKIVLVGTYREGQLAWIKKSRLYNYPVREGDKFGAALGKVSELWLYAGTKAQRHCYEAKFVRQMTREEWLKENPTYRKKVKGRGQEEKVKVKGEGEQRNDNPLNSSGTNKAYYVFEVKPLEYGTRFDAPEVITRVTDFGGRSAKIRKAIEQYEKDGKFASLAAYLPTELSQVPKSQLRVCEPCIQVDFFDELAPAIAKTLTGTDNKLKLATVFSGIGAIEQALLRTHIDHEIVFACDNGDQTPFVCGAIEWQECVDTFKKLSKQVNALVPMSENQRWAVLMIRKQREIIQALLNGAPAMSKRPERELKDRVQMLYEAIGFYKFRVDWDAERDWKKRKQLVDMLYRPLLGRNKVRQSYLANYPVADDRFQMVG